MAKAQKAPPRRRKPKPPPYESVENLLYGIAWRWSRMHGGNLDDLFSLATDVYLQLCGGKWDGVHDFRSSLRYYVWSALSQHRRVQQRRQQTVPIDYAVDLDTVPVQTSQFSVADFAEGLPDDAAAVVRLVFDTPDQLISRLREQGGNRGGLRRRNGDPYRGYRGCIEKYLMTEQGWGRRRVRESFKTVAEALA